MIQVSGMAALVACTALACGSVAASAQSLRSIESVGRADTRGMASLTIPLGGAKRSHEAKPRLDFAMETSRIGRDAYASPLEIGERWDDRVQVRRTAVSLTLEAQPTMMLNGRKLATIGSRLGADDGKKGGGNTALYVVGGVVLLGVIGVVAVVTDVRDAGSDLIGPAD